MSVWLCKEKYNCILVLFSLIPTKKFENSQLNSLEIAVNIAAEIAGVNGSVYYLWFDFLNGKKSGLILSFAL